MHPLPTKAKLWMSMWVIASRAAVVVAVLGLAWVTGVSVGLALVAVSAALALVSLASIWLPPSGRPVRPGGGLPGDPSGDRFPRTPFPFRPAIADEKPIPDHR